jgi:hypothetical protein
MNDHGCKRLAGVRASQVKAVTEGAELLRVSQQSVCNWVDKFWQTRDVQALADATRSGRPSCSSEQAEVLLKMLLTVTPDKLGYFVTQKPVPLLPQQLWHGIDAHCSGPTVRRGLRRPGQVWKRAICAGSAHRRAIEVDPPARHRRSALDSRVSAAKQCPFAPVL